MVTQQDFKELDLEPKGPDTNPGLFLPQPHLLWEALLHKTKMGKLASENCHQAYTPLPCPKEKEK